MIRRYPVVAAILAITAAPALAQTDPYAMAHIAAANQLGVLEYCQAQGFAGADAVGAEQNAIARLPPSAVQTSDAEALGKQGTLAVPSGATMTLASMASTHSTTVAALCQQMGSSAVQSAAMLAQSGMSPGGMSPGGMTSGMPAMPSFPAGMPAMPGGFPAMGSMPAMPSPAPVR